MNIKKILAVAMLVLACSFTASSAEKRDNGKAKNHREEKVQLKFNAEGKFKIVQFTDVHWIAGNPKSDVAGVMMNEILDAEKPDLVIYTGDLIYGGVAEDGLRKALEPTIERGNQLHP